MVINTPSIVVDSGQNFYHTQAYGKHYYDVIPACVFFTDARHTTGKRYW